MSVKCWILSSLSEIHDRNVEIFLAWSTWSSSVTIKSKQKHVGYFIFIFFWRISTMFMGFIWGWHTMPSIPSGFVQMCNRFPCKLGFHVVLEQNINEAAPPYFTYDNISFLLSAAFVACSVLRWITPVFNGKESNVYFLVCLDMRSGLRQRLPYILTVYMTESPLRLSQCSNTHLHLL